MTINEIANELNITKRAMKYYEEQGLLKVAKDSNGYRNYSEQDVETLRVISVYRKLGISISDIKRLLEKEDKDILLGILADKEKELREKTTEYEQLKVFVETGKIDHLSEVIPYESIGKAITDAVPGFYGYYFLHHFLPFLQGRIETAQQQEAYEVICTFWDNTEIKIPMFMRIFSWISYRVCPEVSAESMAAKMDAQMRLYLDADEEQYEKLKKQVLDGYRLKRMMRFHPVYISQRKFMKELQDKGYNDIFIPNMKKLSPDYKRYHEAMTAMNQRICSELGLYYDTNYNLVRKKNKN
ncbi:MAG: MerR family transcriptional regulator [Lachnospiraceae bacterium]|nr:MerR family transcriptional regulator [Lachnospiraceae bacterium]